MQEKRDDSGRWAPGASGNPKGRPKGIRSLTNDLHTILGETATGDELEAMYVALEIPEGLRGLIDAAENRQQAYAMALVYRMMAGSWQGAEQVYGRLDPIPKRQEISGPGGGPLISASVAVAIAPGDAQGAYLALLRGEEPVDVDPADD